MAAILLASSIAVVLAEQAIYAYMIITSSPSHRTERTGPIALSGFLTSTFRSSSPAKLAMELL